MQLRTKRKHQNVLPELRRQKTKLSQHLGLCLRPEREYTQFLSVLRSTQALADLGLQLWSDRQ